MKNKVTLSCFFNFESLYSRTLTLLCSVTKETFLAIVTELF